MGTVGDSSKCVQTGPSQGNMFSLALYVRPQMWLKSKDKCSWSCLKQKDKTGMK